ncbi:F-box/kelch-repeat protein At3g06240-like [Euphorbia lathyris]|uniref:F-box/kelch-repeat protein At3g06240-like n=1 Tax=Euphorbia lathyris TaxID=212925 RepID=UPI00331438BE
MMPKLPDELTVEIISRLPVKSLIRFKCVCKTWQSIISHPKFAKLQLTRSNCLNHRLLLTTCPPQSVDYEAFAVRKLTYPVIASGGSQDSYVQILGSCDGLVCLFDDNMIMFIWNPTTGDCRPLPNPNADFCGVLLHGIGYNYSTDDYGIVFASHSTANGIIIELYTLKTRIWRRIQDTDHLILETFKLGSGISWNGDLYWLSIKESGVSRVYTVICFDMVEEKFKEILPLPDMDPDIVSVNLGMSESCLCLFSEHEESSFEGFILNINGNQVSYHRLFRYPHHTFTGYGNKALCLTKNGQVVMDSDGWEIYLYHPKTGIFNTSFWVHHDTESQSEIYQESLVSPNC